MAVDGGEGDQPDDGTVLDAFVKLLVADPDEHRTVSGLDGLVRRSLRVRGWLDADRRPDRRARPPSWPPRGVVRRRRRCSPVVVGGPGVTPRRPRHAARCVSGCRQLGAALADGTIGAGHVDAVVNAARHLDDDAKAELAEHAEALVNAAAAMSPGAVRPGGR